MRSRRFTTTQGAITAHSFAIHGSWTVSLWLRRISATGEYGFYTDNGGSPNVLVGDSAGSALVRCQTDSTGSLTYTAASDGAWHQFAMVHDSTAQTLTAYVDGLEVDSSAGVAFIDTTLATFGVIGAITPGGSADIAFPKIWTAPLTAEEIRSEYIWATPHKQEASLYAYWSFDPLSPATDDSGNGHTLTLTGDGEGGSEPPTLLYLSAAGASGGRARTRTRRH